MASALPFIIILYIIRDIIRYLLLYYQLIGIIYYSKILLVILIIVFYIIVIKNYIIVPNYNKKYPNNEIPAGIIYREPSAELRPNQKDSDSLPPYKDLDKILNLYVENFLSINEIYSATKIQRRIIKKIVDLIDKNEFKRRQGPPGIKVTNVAFGKDRRFPITNGFKNY